MSNQKKPLPIQELMLICRDLKQKYPYNEKGVRNSLSTYNEAWQDALNQIEKELQPLLEREVREIRDAVVFSINKRGGTDGDAKLYIERYFTTTEELLNQES